MFRLTVDGAPLTTWRASRMATNLPVTKIAVYKWEDKVGIYFVGKKWDDAWLVEQRTQLCHGPGYVLEGVTRLNIDAPPSSVDDIWTEDAIVHGNIISSNCLTIVGNTKTILDFVSRYNVKLTLEAVAHLTLPTPLTALLPAAEATDKPDTHLAAPPPPPESAEPKLPPQPPRPRPHRSSHVPSTHQGPHVRPTEERRRLVSEPVPGPRMVHTNQRHYERHVGQGLTSQDRSHPRPERPRPAMGHGAAGRPHYEPHRIGPRQHGQVCLVVEE